MPKLKNQHILTNVREIINENDEGISSYKISKELKKKYNMDVNPKTVTVVYCDELIKKEGLQIFNKITNNRISRLYSFKNKEKESYILSINKNDLESIINYYKIIETSFAYVQNKVKENKELSKMWKIIIEGLGFSLNTKEDVLKKLSEISKISKEKLKVVMNG